MTDRQDQRPQLELLELSLGRAADSRNDHPGQQVDGEPEAMAAEEAVGQRRDGHHQAAHDATLDAGGNRVNLLGKLEPITRHAGPELVDRARPLGDGPGTKRRLDQRFVPVAATG